MLLEINLTESWLSTCSYMRIRYCHKISVITEVLRSQLVYKKQQKSKS